jgi:hypothetical protein
MKVSIVAVKVLGDLWLCLSASKYLLVRGEEVLAWVAGGCFFGAARRERWGRVERPA